MIFINNYCPLSIDICHSYDRIDVLVNQPDDAEKYGKELTEKGIIFRTLIDKYGSHSDEARDKAFASGAQIISTDYPPKSDMTGIDYCVTFPGGKTIRLNPAD